MKLLLQAPLTLFYWLLFLLFNRLYESADASFDVPVYELTLPNGNAMSISMTMVFVILGAVLLGFELARAIRFAPAQNNIDALLSMVIAAFYVAMVCFYEMWQHELFFTYTILSLIDALVGLLTILGVSRRSYEMNR